MSEECCAHGIPFGPDQDCRECDIIWFEDMARANQKALARMRRDAERLSLHYCKPWLDDAIDAMEKVAQKIPAEGTRLRLKPPPGQSERDDNAARSVGSVIDWLDAIPNDHEYKQRALKYADGLLEVQVWLAEGRKP